MEKIVESRVDRKGMGFGADISANSGEDIDAMFDQVMPQDLIKYGLIPEFVGRVPVVVSLKSLTEDDLIRILNEPKNALIKQYKVLFGLDGVELTFEEDAVKAIAHKACERKIGARGLRSIMENIMMDIMYEMPSDDSIREFKVTAAMVK